MVEKMWVLVAAGDELHQGKPSESGGDLQSFVAGGGKRVRG